jgi:glycolate oxidase FAD binding subunit
VTLSTLAPRRSDELADVVRAAEGGLRVCGAGTWLDAGHPVRAAHELHLEAFRGVRAYVPDDLTISVGAATTLRELDAATHARGQWCPLLPWGTDDSTVGATVATATSGPFAASLGRPRDLVLGLECVDGRGRVVRAGGRVVKNVAGFDLTRLMTGAWGTLGIITEVHLRLRALPAADETWEVAAADDAALGRFLSGPYAPLAVVPHDVGVEGTTYLVRLAGSGPFVAAARGALQALGRCVARDPAAWTTLRATGGPAPRALAWKWDALSRRLKAQFDPRGVLNPGLLGEAA